MENVPNHIAIIMDGNGRWAKKRSLPRIVGHEYGVKTVREVTEAAAQLGIKYLTLYTFSTENWNRPALEVAGLMSLLVRTLRKELRVLLEKDIKLKTIGDIDSLPKDVAKELKEAIEATKNNTRMTLVLALNYSARWDILHAVKQACIAHQTNNLGIDEITEELFSSFLSTRDIPNPELVIRTSGEQRISNFLLWELAYSEFFFTDVFWPEFTKEHLKLAIEEFAKRERRFGKTSEQLNEKS
jgi:undecaprenyl diphosphate synthase